MMAVLLSSVRTKVDRRRADGQTTVNKPKAVEGRAGVECILPVSPALPFCRNIHCGSEN